MKLLFSLALLGARKPFEDAPVPVEVEPHHHTLFKNDYVLVIHFTLAEGERTFYHIHSHDRVPIELTAANISQQKLNEPEGPSVLTKAGNLSALTLDASLWIHRVHNFGPGSIEVLDIELLQRPQQPSASIAGPVAAENPSARVYQWALAPGATSAMHSHNRPCLIVAVSKMLLKMTAPNGQSSSQAFETGDFQWVDSKVTHSLTNEGTVEGQIVEVELK